MFLTGVNVGFMPAGSYLGRLLGASSCQYLLVPLGMLMGYFIVMAEPSVHVLNKQVEEITTGVITYGSAIPIIMGQNIGTCVTALISSVGATKNADRL